MKNTKLKMAIFQSGLSQCDVAHATKIRESIISLAIHGRYNLDDDQKSKIANCLKKPLKELFKQ